MASEIFVISDTHFQHENFLKFTDDNGERIRPFSSVEEIDELMIQNWNRVVKPGDKVWHLGDVFFGDREKFKKLWPRLNGSKRLVVGNHDDIAFLSRGGFFKKVVESRTWEDMLFTHRPTHESGLFNRRKGTGIVNVHGHIHHNPSPPGPYVNVCVEQINYTPIHIEDLREKCRKVAFS